jgi:hypothetical protein
MVFVTNNLFLAGLKKRTSIINFDWENKLNLIKSFKLTFSNRVHVQEINLQVRNFNDKGV